MNNIVFTLSLTLNADMLVIVYISFPLTFNKVNQVIALAVTTKCLNDTALIISTRSLLCMPS